VAIDSLLKLKIFDLTLNVINGFSLNAGLLYDLNLIGHFVCVYLAVQEPYFFPL